MPSLPILYVLVGHHGGPQFSPTVFKALLCLYHKQVKFEIKELVWTELRAKRDAWQTDRPTLPTLELENGELLRDSDKIAEWLDENHRETPSLFVPDVPASQVSPESLRLARNYYKYINSTFGSPALLDTPFSPFFSSIANGILGLIKEDKASLPSTKRCNESASDSRLRSAQDREYFTSDTKLGVQDGWNKLQKLDREQSIRQAKTFVKPLESLLKSTKFLNGDKPGIVDYTLYGRYAFQRVADPSAAKQIWKADDTPTVVKWIESIEDLYEQEMKDQKSRWPEEAK
ncbi:hypothetical protein JCM3766R1_007171 [Sporobolomyces carnicolor]